MSLFGALTTAVDGLSAQQDAIGNISDNIANSQTVGFKDIGTSFDELVTASNAQFNAPGGVTASPVYFNSLAGPLQQSSVGTNLAVSGSGFFAVAPPTNSGTGTVPSTTDTLYTRAGDFALNSSDYLVNGSGNYLEGYKVSQTGGQNVTATGALVPIQVSPLVSAPTATQNVTLAANLPSSYAIAGSTGYTAPAPVTETVYDAQGAASTYTIQFNKTGANTWTADITDSGLSPSTYQVTLAFGDGTSSTTPAGTLQSLTDSTGSGVTPALSIGTGTAATVTIPFTNAAGVAQSVTLNLGAYNQATGVTQYNNGSTNPTVQAQSITQDGASSGTFKNLSVDAGGYVTLNYSNGAAVKAFQIPLAQFNAPQNLQRQSGSVFAASSTSGTAQLSLAGANGAGTISPSTLEGSNVDVATEFTKMIVAQQAYTANTKVVTTANSLMTSLLQAIQ